MLRATIVALPESSCAGQRSYVHNLARSLPPHIEAEVRHLRERVLRLGSLRLGRTASLWADYPRAGRDSGDVVHAADTFCVVRGTDVVTIHDLIPLLELREPAARLHVRLFGRRIRASQRVVTPTHYWAQRIRTELGVETDRIQVVRQGVDLFRFQPDPSPVAGFVPGLRHILYAGAYRPYKRVDILIRAVAGIPKLRIVRVGPEGRPAFAQTCRRLASRLGVDLADVGFVPAERMPAYLTQADVVFAASVQEGFGLVPLEAMACGTASVLSDIPVYRETYGELAHYTAGERVEDLRAAIAEALDSPLDGATLRRHAQGYDWHATAQRTAEIYLEAIESRPAGHRPAPDLHGLRLAAPVPMGRIEVAQAIERAPPKLR